MRRDNRFAGLGMVPGVRPVLLALGLALLTAPALRAEDDVGAFVAPGAPGRPDAAAAAPQPAPAAAATPAAAVPAPATAAAPPPPPPPARPVDTVIAGVLARLGSAAAGDGPDKTGPAYDAADANSPSLSMSGDDLDADPGASADDFDAASGKEKPMVGEQEALAAFYREPERKPLWVDGEGYNARARAVLAEFAAAADYGLRTEDFALARQKVAGTADALAEAELALSRAALKYARYARGGRVDPRKLSRFHGRGPRTPDYPKLLGELAKSGKPGQVLRDEHPRAPQFEALRQQLLALGKGGDIADPATEGDEKKRLLILMNMERWRWMPDKMEGDNNIYVWANIPELHVRIVRDGKVVFHEKAIVGLQDKQTPMFDDEMEWIEINPTWYIPDSIKVADILPDVRRGGRMSARYRLKIDCGKHGNDHTKIDWSVVNIRTCKVYQPAGDKSVLGDFKFKFPNQFSVYMHDTLNHRLFDQETRILSHGCVRVNNPRRMAEILLDNDKKMNPEQIGAILASGREHKEHLRRKVPVHTTYFTARVDDDGKLRTYPDYYFYDQRLAEAMFGRGALFPRQSYAGKQYGPVNIPRPEPVVNPLPQFMR